MTGTAPAAVGRAPSAPTGPPANSRTARAASAALGLALAAALLLAGCGGDSAGDATESPGVATPTPTATPSDAPVDEAATPTETPVDEAGAGGLSATDLAWVRLMIPVNEQLLPFLDALAERAEDPALAAFAADLVPGHEAELEALHALLSEAGVAYVNLHEGHNMPGMVTEDELAALAALDGPAFDEEALAHLDEHLTRTAEVSRAETEAGTDPATVALAADLDRARSTQSAELDRLTG